MYVSFTLCGVLVQFCHHFQILVHRCDPYQTHILFKSETSLEATIFLYDARLTYASLVLLYACCSNLYVLFGLVPN